MKYRNRQQVSKIKKRKDRLAAKVINITPKVTHKF